MGETHQPDWVVYVRDSEKFQLTNVIPERIIFVSRGITVHDLIVHILSEKPAMNSLFFLILATASQSSFGFPQARWELFA